MSSDRKPVLIDTNPGRSAQTYGIARELGTDIELAHSPSVGVIGNKGDSQCYLGVQRKVETIHEALRQRLLKRGVGVVSLPKYNAIRVAFSSTSLADIDKLVGAIAAEIKEGA